MATNSTMVQCQCGEWSGEPCQWSGDRAETVRVEWMPEWLRESHQAAGNAGSYPANGAQRIRVHNDCARLMVENDGEWCEIL